MKDRRWVPIVVVLAVLVVGGLVAREAGISWRDGLNRIEDLRLMGLSGLPIYLFVNSLKLTHWTSDDQKINLKEHTKSLGGVEYAHVSHSHDVVDLALVDHVITEQGEIDKAEIHGYRLTRDD